MFLFHITESSFKMQEKQIDKTNHVSQQMLHNKHFNEFQDNSD